MHTGGGGEYFKAKIDNHTTTTPKTPEHNPFSERFNCTWLDPARFVLQHSNLPPKYWEWAMMFIVYVKNRLPHASIGCSPYEKLTKKKPNLSKIRPFGCAACVYDHEPKSKLHPRALAGILLACEDNGVYTVEIIEDRHIIRSVHVKFDEAQYPGGAFITDESDSEDTDLDYEESQNQITSGFPSDYSSDESEREEDSLKIVLAHTKVIQTTKVCIQAKLGPTATLQRRVKLQPSQQRILRKFDDHNV